jgi:hypothetical protein
MKSFDNKGNLVGEINTSRTSDNKVVTTNTIYDTGSGRPISQHIAVRDSQGKVTVENIIGGKLLP